MQNELNPEDRERVKATFEHGTDGFSEEDMEQLKRERETAERKSTHLGEQFESFRLTWELLQDYFTSGNLLNEVRRLIEDPEYKGKMLAGYSEIRESLGGGGASEAVAKAMVMELGNS